MDSSNEVVVLLMDMGVLVITLQFVSVWCVMAEE